MNKKERILGLIDTEINQLIEEYEKNERVLLNKIRSLEGKVDSYEKQMDKYKNQSIVSERQIGWLFNGVNEELIDQLCYPKSREEEDLFLSVCNYLLKNEDIPLIVTMLKRVQSKPEEFLNRKNAEFNDEFVKFLRSSLKQCSMEDSEEFDRLLTEILIFFRCMYKSELSGQIKRMLAANADWLFDHILILNEPEILAHYLRVLQHFSLFEILEVSMEHIAEVEWDYIKYSLSPKQFSFFLWYSYMNEKDEKLMRKSGNQINYNLPEVNLYLYIYKHNTYHKKDLEQKVEQFKEGLVFTDHESMWILRKVNAIKTLNDLVPHNKSKAMNPIYLLPGEWDERLTEYYGFKTKIVNLPLYRSSISETPDKFIEKEVYVDVSSKDVLMTQSDIKYIKSKYGMAPKVSTTGFRQFSWPSTEVKEEKTEENKDQTLNEQSALRKTGYHISGKMNRQKRWSILERAVVELGLRRVAYTIAYNVKMRKGQKNGEVKYSYAIGEWEYDLAKLKNHYYNHSFEWPTT
ncbi:hypothetical protein [Jeotgalibacillus sp. JSM ZJ347]|uniref:hypothetical protein n=1 Tax=Jeotgalibacillus sp. JSM ZJ347 TaxID=3342117 RepID=UPI0035A92FE2